MLQDRLTGREYKLLIAMRQFPGEASLPRANAFWKDRLIPVIGRHLGPQDGQSRHNKGFKDEKTEERRVLYYDAPSRVLAENDYTLRDRRPAGEGGKRKVTLKLRMADQFVVAGTRLHNDGEDLQTKLEEDIAPLAAAADDRTDAAQIALAKPRSIRSRFARSVSRTIAADRPLSQLQHALELFPRLEENLNADATGRLMPGEKLLAGPEIREVGFAGAKVDFGDGAIGKFTLTLWYFRPDAARRDVAEISFRCAFDGAMPGAAARRALTLFVAMQDELGDVLDLQGSSKTALALPR